MIMPQGEMLIMGLLFIAMGEATKLRRLGTQMLRATTMPQEKADPNAAISHEEAESLLCRYRQSTKLWSNGTSRAQSKDVVGLALNGKAVQDKEQQQGPTDFIFSGCFDGKSTLDGRPDLEDHMAMTVDKCFLFCSNKAKGGFRSLNYFGITQGTKCWCSHFIDGPEVSEKTCDVKCTGDPSTNCGGLNSVASVYYMMDCSPTEEERKRQAKRQLESILGSYAVFDGQSCGRAKGNKVEVSGGATKIASVQDCKLACWQERGSEYCHGFTWEDQTSTCTFHADVLDGTAEKKDGMKCFWKKLGLEPGYPR